MAASEGRAASRGRRHDRLRPGFSSMISSALFGRPCLRAESVGQAAHQARDIPAHPCSQPNRELQFPVRPKILPVRPGTEFSWNRLESLRFSRRFFRNWPEMSGFACFFCLLAGNPAALTALGFLRVGDKFCH